MASNPVNPSGGAPSPGGPGGAPPPSPQGGGDQGGQTNPLHLIAAITRLAQMLSQAAPGASQEAEAIIQSVQSAARKIIPNQGQGQQQQSPF